MESEKKLVVEGLTKSFATPDGALKILDDLNFCAQAGEAVAIVGPSGCGKSTLLHLLGALDTPSSGRISLNGVDPFSLNETELARFRNEKIGFVFQEHHLLPQLTALENVLIPILATGSVKNSDQASALALLKQVGLQDRAQHLPSRLSGGERQRVAVARALIRSPILVLADEPTGSLDQNNAGTIGRLLLDLHSANESILICVTHSRELAAMFPRCLQLDHGMLKPQLAQI